MKTFWVIQKIPDSTTDHLNPLQRYQYDLRRKSTGLSQNGGQTGRNRFHSVPTIPNLVHGRSSLPLPSYSPSPFTTMEGKNNPMVNGGMHNLVTSFPCNTKTPPQLQGIRRSLTPGPDEWPEAEQALCSPEDFSSFKDLDSPVNLSNTVQVLQPHHNSNNIDLNQLQLELASLKLSNGPNLAELAHRLMAHARDAEALANGLLKMLRADQSLDSQEHCPHEEMPTATLAQPSHGLARTPSSPRMEPTLSPIRECGTADKAYDKLQVPADADYKRTASKTTPLEENSTNQHIGINQMHSPVGTNKLCVPSSPHLVGPIYMSSRRRSSNQLIKSPPGKVTGAEPSTMKSSARTYNGIHSSVDRENASGQYACNIL